MKPITQLRPFQREGVDQIHEFGGRCLLADDLGLGKAQPLDAKLLTPTGWVRMGGINIGDFVIGRSGKPIKVLSVHPQGRKEVFRCTFSDGAITECCGDHLWEVNTSTRRRRGNPGQVLELREIQQTTAHKNGVRRYFIPLVEVVEFQETNQFIHPYVLGYMLANGCFRQDSPSVSIPDQETIIRITKLLPDGITLTHKGGASIDFSVRKNRLGPGPNSILDELRYLGLMGLTSYEKHVPAMYLYGDKKQRTSLLRGLMDGDGWMTNGVTGYSSSSSALANGVVELVRSLGGVVRRFLKKEPKYTYNGERRIGRPAHVLTITMPQTINPFRLSRKALMWSPRTKYKATRCFASVESVGFKNCQCIKVDAEDGLYVTDDYLVTHNTIQSLSFMYESKSFPAVVVCPKSLKLGWQRQAKQHMGMESRILSRTRPCRIQDLRDERLLIINYDVLRPWLPVLKALSPKLIIGDEVHMIGSLRAQRTHAFRNLCKNVPHVLGLSGTPLTNRPFELFPILNILRPNDYPNPFAFGHAYCESRFKFGGWDFSGAKNLRELHRKLLMTVMLRRLKKDVLKDLPAKRRYVVPVEISNRKEYERAEKDLIGWLAETSQARASSARRAERFARFTYLKKLAADGKMNSVLDWIDSFLEESEGKLLIGCIHRDIIADIEHEYGKLTTVIHGGKSSKQRDEAEQLFKYDKKVRILTAQMKAAGVGLNLPEARGVLVTELPYAPATCLQFENRAHRLTSVNEVDVYYLVADNTIETRLCEILEHKCGILDQVLDGVAEQEDSLTIFDEMEKALIAKQRRL
jgi:hypothetical protein